MTAHIPNFRSSFVRSILSHMNTNQGEREIAHEDLKQPTDSADQNECAAAWLAEARRREAEFRAGAAPAKPVEEVIARLISKAKRLCRP